MARQPHVPLDWARWDLAKRVLIGDDPKRVSMSAAASAVGVTVRNLKRWHREAVGDGDAGSAIVPDDDYQELLADVRETFAARDELQGQRLEDELWSRSLNGTVETTEKDGAVTHRVKHDNRLAMRMLEKRDPSYHPAAKIESDSAGQLSPRELFDNLKRIQQLAIARKGMVIDSTAEEIMDLDRRGLLDGTADPEAVLGELADRDGDAAIITDF